MMKGLLIILGIFTISVPGDSGATADEFSSGATIIGYDCSSPRASYTTIDLTRITPCKNSHETLTTNEVMVQVLQTQIYRPIHVYTCTVTLTRVAFGCGMHSHVYLTPQTLYSAIIPIGRDRCMRVHQGESFKYGDITIATITPNSTSVASAILAGSVSDDGGCKGAAVYKDEGGTFKNVVVQGQLEIRIQDYIATALLDEDKLLVSRLALTCPLRSGYCTDSQQGEVMWTFYDEKDCKDTSVDVLYQGAAIITKDPLGQETLVVRSTDVAFAVHLNGHTRLCAQEVYRTEHGRIHVAVRGHTSFYFSKSANFYPLNIELTQYTTSKLLYITTMVRLNEEGIVREMVHRDCETRRIALENRIILAQLSPDKVSLMTEGPGVYGRVLGEVLYVIQCVPISATLQYTSSCYQEIPVIYKNKTAFLTPVTHLLVDRGQEVPCESLVQPKFLLGNRWYTRTPRLMETEAPTVLDPNSDLTWEYKPLLGIAAAGLYSADQLRTLQREMMFPSVREAVNTALIRKITATGGSGFDPLSLWSDTELANFSTTIAGNLSWFFKFFGHYASIVLGCYMCWKLISYCFSVILNCCTLKKARKPWYCLLGGLIDSLTSIFTIHYDLFFKSSKQPTAPSEPHDMYLEDQEDLIINPTQTTSVYPLDELKQLDMPKAPKVWYHTSPRGTGDLV